MALSLTPLPLRRGQYCTTLSYMARRAARDYSVKNADRRRCRVALRSASPYERRRAADARALRQVFEGKFGRAKPPLWNFLVCGTTGIERVEE